MGNQLQSDYMEYKMSRAEWERAYIDGLELLGFKYENKHNLSKELVVQLTQF